MTQKHLVDRGFGTEVVFASSPEEALRIAAERLGAGEWRYAGVDEPLKPWPAPKYQGISRDPLDTEE